MKQTILIFAIAFSISIPVAALPAKSSYPALNNNETPCKNECAIVPDFKTGIVKINFRAKRALAGRIVVLDQKGNTVLQQDASIKAGINTIPIHNFTNLNEGTYDVYVKAGKRTQKTTYLLWK